MAYKISNTAVLTSGQDSVFDGFQANTCLTFCNLPSPFTGTLCGFRFGGQTTFSSGCNVIESFPFASDTNSTDHGDLSSAALGLSGHGSDTHGYGAGGQTSSPTRTNAIRKFPFASTAGSTDIGSLNNTSLFSSGSQSLICGYVSLGYDGATVTPTNIMESFPFASDTNATDVGDFVNCDFRRVGIGSYTDGYFVSGTAFEYEMQSFPFASESNISSVGTLGLIAATSGNGLSTSDDGFLTDNNGCPISKFSYISGNEVSLESGFHTCGFSGNGGGAGMSSTTHGYVSAPGSPTATYCKFSFFSDTGASCVGNLTVTNPGVSGDAGTQNGRPYDYLYY